LADESLVDVYRRALRNQMNEMADVVSGGGAQSFEEYKKMVGIIEGLAIAERELLDLLEAKARMENEED
tara:strand:- start:10744 stop:10950 length:207 start_codon:yes stop_codon:yes gene_type:complete